ncbi:15438_t:CDS:1 [Cetraspora pellucida]|uniref:15438_t:CDS:1 n=1 Tax=Cetraspora pellucida TaxID=1433469 RepID=A0A9N9K553_9GLOM|nr:15438_t:CDS:1 [Cetraspora pellucida]
MNSVNSVILVGRTGDGKSSLANMMTQGDLFDDENKFPISNKAVGETSVIEYCIDRDFEVYDTIGLCEARKGSTLHEKAIKGIRTYFSRVSKPVHYICYVKKGTTRFTKEDRTAFKEFKKIFSKAESNFVIIITDSNQEWVNENVNTIRDYFGNYNIIAVDFPFRDRYNNVAMDERNRIIRMKNREHLSKSLLNLCYKGVKLNILSPSEYREDKVSKIIAFVPVIGATYNLISASVYHFILDKDAIAADRFKQGMNLGIEDFKTIAAHFGNSFVSPTRFLGKLLK